MSLTYVIRRNGKFLANIYIGLKRITPLLKAESF